MAYLVIGNLSVRRLRLENGSLLYPLYCGSCSKQNNSRSQRRHYHPINHGISYLHTISASCTNNHGTSSYHKAKPFLSPHLTISPSCISSHFTLDPSFSSIRQFHISNRHLYEDKSVVEKAVEVLKDKLKSGKKDEPAATIEKVETKEIPKVKEDVKPEPKVTQPDSEKAVVVPKKSLYETMKGHMIYYRDGFVLLYKESKIASSYLWKSLFKGQALTRREVRQLNRTAADLFRMIPYMVFLIVPFFEFLIPVYLKFFPNALPSTFERGNTKKADIMFKEQLKRKQEMGKFLQETLQKTSLEKKKKKEGPGMVDEFTDFMEKVRTEGITVSNDEILRFSKLFEDEITVDSLSRSQLQALCRVLSITPFGTDHILRFQLDVKLRRLLVDDKMIIKEGVDSLTVAELQQANRARGMRALGVDKDRLKLQLQQWLDLHLNQRVPTSLLLLSRALYLPEELSQVEQLQKTIQSLPKTATDEATMRAAEISGEKMDPARKIEILQAEQEAIEKESMDKKALEEKAKQEQIQKEEFKAEAVAARVVMEGEELKDRAPEIVTLAEEEIASVSAEEELSTDDLKEIESAIEEIALEKKFNIDEEILQDLKEDVDEYKEDLEDLRSVILASGGTEEDIKESKSAKRLSKRVDKLVTKLDKTINELHQQRHEINEEIDVKEIRLKYAEMDNQKERDEFIKKISEKKGLVISINDMVLALRRLQKVPDEVRLQKIVQVLDEDHDGKIDVSHVLKVIKLLGQENVKLESSQITELIDICKKEMAIAEEEKQKEKEEKEKQKQSEVKSENQEQS